MPKRWIFISLIFLLCVALIGTLLRGVHLLDLPFDYSHLVHAHSHVAFQGWVYTAFMLLAPSLYLSELQIKQGKYKLQFALTVATVLGILVSFSLWGYGLYSILCSTLMQFLQYIFVYRFFKDSKAAGQKENPYSLRFLKAGFLLGVLSTMGPWVVGVLSAKGLADSEGYHSAIYFFLHFQYNGWFLFVVLGLIFKMLENAGVAYNLAAAKRFYTYLLIAVFPAYALSLLGMSFRPWIFWPAVGAGFLQLIACYWLVQMLNKTVLGFFREQALWVRRLLFVACVAFFLKQVLQFSSLFAFVEHLAFGSRNLIMAYMHLCFLGLISTTLFASLLHFKFLPYNRFSTLASGLFLIGFVGTECILVLSGLGYTLFENLLFAFSAAMALAVLFYAISARQKQPNLEA